MANRIGVQQSGEQGGNIGTLVDWLTLAKLWMNGS